MHEVASAMSDGWLVSDRAAWIFVGAWIMVVLAYGLLRSFGEARQDPIRSSGPLP